MTRPPLQLKFCTSPRRQEKVTLPALDLPISRTGLLLYYPPLFRVSAEPGTFHPQAYQNPVSAALEPPSGGVGGFATASTASPKPLDRLEQFAQLQANDEKEKKDATQALLDTFKAKSLSGQAEFNFQHDKKAGAR